MKRIIKIIAVIIGTIIGAGFASGKEIYVFFAEYGKLGIIGAIISSILTGTIIYCTIAITKKNNINNNNQFVKVITSNKSEEIIKNIINIFLLISFWIMCTGICTFFKQEMNIPIIVTATINSIFVYFLLMKNIKGIMKINMIIIPVMLIIIIYITLKNTNISYIINTYSTNRKIIKAIFMSLLYTNYNTIVLIPIIVSLTKYINTKKEAVIVAIISSTIVFVLILCLCQLLLSTSINIQNIEIPILAILDNYNKNEKILYSLAIVVAIITSIISAGYGILENIKDKKKYKIVTLIMCILTIPISYIGFGKLVEVLYPTFGLIGIFQAILILKTTNSIAKNEEN